MKLKLSFQADPPIPYHTFSYHRKKSLLNKAEYFEDQYGYISSETQKILRELFTIPEDFSIHLLKNKLSGNKDYSTQINLFNSKEPNKWPSFSLDVFSELGSKIPRQISSNTTQMTTIPYIEFATGAQLQKTTINSLNSIKSGILNIDYSHAVPLLPKEAYAGYSFSFSVNYGVGVPLPVYVWITRELPDLESLIKLREKLHLDQANGSDILIVKEVLVDFQRRGIQIINNETVYKSVTLYQALEKSKHLSPLIDNESDRSACIVCGKSNQSIGKLQSYFESKGFVLDFYKGGSNEESTIRIANYPVHSKEQVEMLADAITAF